MEYAIKFFLKKQENIGFVFLLRNKIERYSDSHTWGSNSSLTQIGYSTLWTFSDFSPLD